MKPQNYCVNTLYFRLYIVGSLHFIPIMWLEDEELNSKSGTTLGNQLIAVISIDLRD